MAARSAELSAQASRIAGLASGTSCTMYLRFASTPKVVQIFLVFILELCDDSIAGPSSSQSKEKVVAVSVGHRASCWREDLEKSFLVKIPRKKKDSLTSVFSAVTSATLPSARTTRMLRMFSAP